MRLSLRILAACLALSLSPTVMAAMPSGTDDPGEVCDTTSLLKLPGKPEDRRPAKAPASAGLSRSAEGDVGDSASSSRLLHASGVAVAEPETSKVTLATAGFDSWPSMPPATPYAGGGADLSLLLAGLKELPNPATSTACARKMHSGARNQTVVAAVAVGLFFCMLMGVKALTSRQRESSQQGQLEPGREVAKDSESIPPENLNALLWGNFATFCCGVNYNVVLAGSLKDMAGVTGSVTSVGLWIGVWAGGAILSLPVFLMVPMRKCIYAMRMQAIFVITGNVIMIFGMFQRQLHWMLIGRFITGLEGGVKYTLDYMSLDLTPASGSARVEALLNARISAGMGNSIGMILQPTLWLLASGMPRWLLLDFFPDDTVAHMALPLLAMNVYGLVYLIGLNMSFKDPIPYERDAKEESARRPITWGIWGGISASVACQLTRNLKSSLLKSAVVLVITADFCSPWLISPVLFAVQISCFMSMSVTKEVLKESTPIHVMKGLEGCETLSLLLLFRFLGTSEAGLFVYLLGLQFFFNFNNSGGGLNMSLGAQSTNEAYILTSKKTLAVYAYMARMLAWLLGPVIAFWIASWGTGMNLFSAAVALLTLAQSAITYFWLAGSK